MTARRWRRFGAVFGAVAAVAVALAALDVLLGACCGVEPEWAAGTYSDAMVVSVGRKVAALEKLLPSRRGAEGVDPSEVAVVGLSPVAFDLDARTLEANDPQHRKWLVLGGQGRTFSQLEIYARPLLESTLRPGVVILGLQLGMARHDDSADHQDVSPRRLLGDLRQLRLNHVLLDASFIMRNRDGMADGVGLLMYRGAAVVRRVFGLPMSATFAPSSDPWSPDDRFTTEHVTGWLAEAEWRGHQMALAPEEYVSAERQVRALVRLVGSLRGRGAEVMGVLMPETSRLRAIYPAIVGERFDEAVQAAEGSEKMKIVDLREAMPDELFFDEAHLNEAGRQGFSRELPGVVR